MKIAILGGGFAGLATAWFLFHYSKGSVNIDLFDKLPIGKGASGLSTGLLHPYPGKHARKSWESTQGINETHRLLTEASRSLNQPLVLSKGILRPAISEQQLADFQKCAEKHSDVEWWDKKSCENKIPGLLLPEQGGGLYIKEGVTIDVSNYLLGLWQSCTVLGMHFYHKPLTNPDLLATYDRVVIAMGPACKNFIILKDLPTTPVKGQILELSWPEKLPPLKHNLVSDKYIVMSREQKSCFVGSTYERDFASPDSDEKKAVADILPSISTFFPPLAHAKILNCKSGVRSSSSSHLPLVGALTDQIYFFTGLGSKGLIYHAWLGKLLARTIISQDLSHIPKEVLYTVKKPSVA